jgi:hypothetical protein
MMDGYWEHVNARISEGWRDLLIDGEHTLPDGSTVQRTATGDYRRVIGGKHTVPDFSSVYEVLVDEPRSLIETARAGVPEDNGHYVLVDEAKACTFDPCPPYVETTFRVGQPAVVPTWVRAAIDRIEREWSDHLHVLHGIEPAAHRVLTYPSLMGGYWLREVPNEPPLIVETLCERCTGVGLDA